ncbi:hypothetical protein Xcel_0845 [Xylanimonas cellulosilytica DSM 15894]|uniref:ATP/GTP-binding protein n=1 Tax=Xylanimonas cellulosilytica (strain DSM 15894 / JCM 12276 / CECT 5975 / KCTC 9989 / LMG 20990 / NBRC 107835 / XIL07) TaxID=446471 RepID=D1BY36_XYLCX|nr:hypothetical protein [Xylanimonas cellulosilytica]ACZ29879.1 hypothetical protein Xcel_0845 [Xylanimonas cellulosilytica DSM 15894]
MRARFLIAATAATTAVLTAVVGLAPAQADGPDCKQVDRTTGKCLVFVDPPPPPAHDTEPVSDPAPGDSRAGSACVNDLSIWNAGDDVVPVACTSDAGYWSNAYGCYIQLMDPQPPPRPERAGTEGAVYTCTIPPPRGGMTALWLESPPDAAEAGPSPREIAQRAVDSMDLHAIDIGMVPEPGPDRVGIVGLPVWMWAANPGASTTGPQTASASAGGITITATARIQRITWDMGDGTTVVCDGPGTPYQDKFGKTSSPDCGHTYTTSSANQPDGRFTVSATSDWVISWEGAGQTGTIRLDGLARSVQVAIGEVQVLVQP